MQHCKVFVLTDNEIQYNNFKHLIDNLAINAEFDFFKSPKGNFKNSRLDSFNIKDNHQFVIDNYDIVFSIHSKQIFPEVLVNSIPCINVHPGYNPYNRGWYPQVFAIIENNIIGATIHLMDKELDHGDIIARKVVRKYTWDTSESLYNRILEAEIELLKENLNNILTLNFKKQKPEEKGVLRLKKDFNNLCQIDMEKKGTFKEFYDYMRALTHGNYKNAYFFDPETGLKIYLEIKIKKESK